MVLIRYRAQGTQAQGQDLYGHRRPGAVCGGLPDRGVVWRYRYGLNGKYEKLTPGKYPALTLKNARLKRDEAAHQVPVGKSLARKQQKRVAGAEDATMTDFAERFFKEHPVARP